MRPRLTTFCVLTVATFAACSDASAPTAPARATPPSGPARTVVNFGSTAIGAPGEVSFIAAINDAGQVALTQNVASDLFGALWVNGSSQLLHDASSGSTQARGLNALGTVVGVASGTGTTPAVWEGGVFAALSLYPGSTGAIASAINDAGQIVGYDPDALFWPDKSAAAPVRLQSPGSSNRPLDINNAGMIVGVTDDGSSTAQAVVWTSATSASQMLAGLGGTSCQAKSAQASAINELGEIVGRCPAPGGGLHAVYWANKDATPVDLDLLAGGSLATGINELGQIIGNSNSSRAMLWSREGGVFRRFDLGVPGNLDVAVGIALNNTGQAVLQANDQADVVRQSFLVSIPMRATIDVDPGSAANAIKLSSRGTVTVALLGSRWFRAGDVDPATLTLGNDDGLDTRVSSKKGVPVAKLTDVNRDGFVDLVVDFDEGALLNNGDLAVGTQTLVLLGSTRNGAHVRGTDVASVSK